MPGKKSRAPRKTAAWSTLRPAPARPTLSARPWHGLHCGQLQLEGFGALVTTDVPLFPLSGLVMPGGLMPLRIFETRYHDMVRDCMRGGTGFVVVLLAAGQETGREGRPHEVGTYVEIIDFESLDHGFLGIVCRGQHRVRILTPHQTRTGLWVGDTEAYGDEPDGAVPESYEHLADLALQLVTELGPPFDLDAPQPHNARWVSSRLTELLPIPGSAKQQLLELRDPIARLHQIACFVQQMVRARPGS